MLSAAAPEFRGKLSQFFLVAVCAAGFDLAAAAPAPAGDDATVNQPTQLKAWTGPDKPPFALEDVSGRSVRLEAGGDLLTIVHFFATWCEPCRAELPSLDRLIARTDPTRLRVLAISVAEADARIRNFVDKYSVSAPILLDRDRAVARQWSVHTLPTTFLLDRDLRPRLFIEHEYDWDSFDVSSAARAMTSEKNAALPAGLPPLPTPTTTEFRGGQP